MQKASLRSPLYTFLLPLLSFCFPPPPGTPRVKFKVQELQESFYALSNTPCILPAWRTESQWSSFTYPRRSPSLTPSTKWQNVQRKKSANGGKQEGLCETSLMREARSGREGGPMPAVMKSALASHLLWHFRHGAGCPCSAGEASQPGWPHDFCPLLGWLDIHLPALCSTWEPVGFKGKDK